MDARWIVFFAVLSWSAMASASYTPIEGFPIIRNLTSTEPDNLPGMTHITIAGAVQHGFKEVEVWIETAAPGAHTPIHRHSCEEVIYVIKGSGTLYLASNAFDGGKYPGTPQEFHFSTNSSVHVPPNHVHQAWNTDPHEDLHVLVVLSKPPLKLSVYSDWSAPHDSAKEMFPSVWDKKYFKPAQTNDEL